ncbi:hypothetical protein [Evtepia sp.]|uniref:hypothetical protein n=1 Tax=Evtepia sp. TaxID=2773933 RepID=UPI003F15CA2E
MNGYGDKPDKKTVDFDGNRPKGRPIRPAYGPMGKIFSQGDQNMEKSVANPGDLG